MHVPRYLKTGAVYIPRMFVTAKLLLTPNRENIILSPAVDAVLTMTPPFPPLSFLMCSRASIVPRTTPICYQTTFTGYQTNKTVIPAVPSYKK